MCPENRPLTEPLLSQRHCKCLMLFQWMHEVATAFIDIRLHYVEYKKSQMFFIQHKFQKMIYLGAVGADHQSSMAAVLIDLRARSTMNTVTHFVSTASYDY
ncbi:hypothetical protein EVAR_78583_1 [Eumeta japonica]|uniref:Uncharacterized protein n=1 Tax=Eumeta variegata TaxID=151549 RepID=A0A4C1W8N9_EUMVA|nr:hypothetical protein EVAR_78583_1 [Eumeta japonica]